MIKSVKRGRQTWWLCRISQLQSSIEILSWCQKQCNHFLNIEVKPYKGRKYNPDKFVWIVEG